MNNKLITIQEMIMEEMKRLSEKDVDANEISRSNALTNGALTYIKTVNLGIRIKETATKMAITEKSLTKELGIEYED